MLENEDSNGKNPSLLNEIKEKLEFVNINTEDLISADELPIYILELFDLNERYFNITRFLHIYIVRNKINEQIVELFIPLAKFYLLPDISNEYLIEITNLFIDLIKNGKFKVVGTLLESRSESGIPMLLRCFMSRFPEANTLKLLSLLLYYDYPPEDLLYNEALTDFDEIEADKDKSALKMGYNYVVHYAINNLNLPEIFNDILNLIDNEEEQVLEMLDCLCKFGKYYISFPVFKNLLIRIRDSYNLTNSETIKDYIIRVLGCFCSKSKEGYLIFFQSEDMIQLFQNPLSFSSLIQNALCSYFGHALEMIQYIPLNYIELMLNSINELLNTTDDIIIENIAYSISKCSNANSDFAEVCYTKGITSRFFSIFYSDFVTFNSKVFIARALCELLSIADEQYVIKVENEFNFIDFVAEALETMKNDILKSAIDALDNLVSVAEKFDQNDFIEKIFSNESIIDPIEEIACSESDIERYSNTSIEIKALVFLQNDPYR